MKQNINITQAGHRYLQLQNIFPKTNRNKFQLTTHNNKYILPKINSNANIIQQHQILLRSLPYRLQKLQRNKSLKQSIKHNQFQYHQLKNTLKQQLIRDLNTINTYTNKKVNYFVDKLYKKLSDHQQLFIINLQINKNKYHLNKINHLYQKQQQSINNLKRTFHLTQKKFAGQ